MHCPRCGTAAFGAQQFCRSCGLHLEKIAELLGEANIPTDAPSSEISRLKQLQLRHEHWGKIAGLITFALILILFIFIVFSQMILKGGILVLPGSLLILLAMGAGVLAYFQASAKSLKQKLSQPELSNAAPASVDTSGLVSPGSITDRTTELLSERSDRKTEEVAN